MHFRRNMLSVTNLIINLNKRFPKIVHPFDLQNEGIKTYAQWEFEHGIYATDCFSEFCSEEEMLKDKRILDMGCGAGGKSIYFLSRGAKHVVGVDIFESYDEESNAFAAEMGYKDKFTFVCASACDLPFDDNSFDVVIMNDFFEHVDDPEGALREALRLLVPGGRIYINFPPYFHPQGGHMTDVIYIPYVHLFFSEKQLIKAYKQLVKGLPDEEMRLNLRFSKDEKGKERYTYINHMSLRRAKKIMKKLGIVPEFYKEVTIGSRAARLSKIPFMNELFVHFGVYVIKK